MHLTSTSIKRNVNLAGSHAGSGVSLADTLAPSTSQMDGRHEAT